MMRVFLDANVLFTAAHNPNGKAALVIQLAAMGTIELFTSAYAREEASRNLTVKYPAAAEQLAEILLQIKITPTNPAAPYPESLPLKDANIFQAARTCRATHLLTGDIKHFGDLMNRPDRCSQMIIQTVAEFLDTR